MMFQVVFQPPKPRNASRALGNPVPALRVVPADHLVLGQAQGLQDEADQRRVIRGHHLRFVSSPSKWVFGFFPFNPPKKKEKKEGILKRARYPMFVMK